MKNTNFPLRTGDGDAFAPTPMNLHIGRRLQMRRRALLLSEKDLAYAAGLSIARIKAYESGTVPITVYPLYDLSQILGVQPSYFFEDSPSPDLGPFPETANLSDPLTEEVLTAFDGIPSPTLKTMALRFLKCMALTIK